MCLAVPGKILDIFYRESLKMGRIDYAGVVKDACLDWLPDAAVGEYVIVHVGFALNKIDEAEALETLRLLEQIEGSAIAPE